MHRIVPTLVVTLFLGACSSSGELIEGSENYEGPQAAAVAPVTDRRSGRAYGNGQLEADIQRNIQRQLDQSGIFAGVVALERPDDGNEAEVIIEPALVGRETGDLDLKVRVTEKTGRKMVLNETYRGSGGEAGVLNVAVQELENDLATRYGK